MKIERDNFNDPLIVIDLPSGAVARVRFIDRPDVPIFESHEVHGMTAPDLEALAHGLLAVVREMKHPDGLQQTQNLPEAT